MSSIPARSGARTDAAILDAIRRSPDTTRVAIARELGVTAATVTNSIKRLIADGLVLESGRARSTGGKPASLLRVSTTSRWAVGCTVESDRLSLVAMGVTGALRGRVMLPLGDLDEARLAEPLRAALDELGALDPAQRQAFTGIGIADLRGHGLGVEEIGAAVRELTGAPVVIGTAAVCAGLGSAWVGEQDPERPCLTVHLGPTIGVALLRDGRPLLPATGWPGELDQVAAGPDGTPLHEIASPAADVRRALDQGLGAVLGLDPAGERVLTDHARLTEAAGHGDERAAAVVTASARAIAGAVAGIAGPLGIERVVLSGTSVSMAPRIYREAFAGVLRSRTGALPPGLEVAVSTVQPHPCSVGAAALALTSALSPAA